MIVRRPGGAAEGYEVIVAASGEGGDGLGFGLLRLGPGAASVFDGGEERAWLLLAGSVRFDWPGGSHEASRSSMAGELPASLYHDAFTPVTIRAGAGGAELAAFSVPRAGATGSGGLRRGVLPVPAEAVRVASLSPARLEGTADREIRTVLDDDNAPFASMTVGEVVNRPGRWSSYPPHHHSQRELYHYRFFPSGGFGFCGIGKEAFRVEDGDTVDIPPGLIHPQVSAPGYSMIYLWGIRHLEGDRFGAESRKYAPEQAWLV